MTARVAPISPPAQGPNVLSRPAALASQAPLAQKLKILHVFNFIGLGGTALSALRLIQHLGNQDFTHKLFGLRGADRAMLAVRYPDADVFTPENAEKRSKFQFLL